MKQKKKQKPKYSDKFITKIYKEYISGDSYYGIGERHDVPKTSVRYLILRHIDKKEYAL